MGDWTLFSNHGHVLLYLAGNTEARLRDVAAKVGITERAVQKIVRELQDADYLTVTKHGRCNRYRIHARKPLRHPIESHCTVASIVQLVTDGGAAGGAEAAPPTRAEKPVKARAEPRKAEAPRTPKPETPKPGARPEPAREKAKSRKSEEDDGEPSDSRQQGSLF